MAERHQRLTVDDLATFLHDRTRSTVNHLVYWRDWNVVVEETRSDGGDFNHVTGIRLDHKNRRLVLELEVK